MKNAMLIILTTVCINICLGQNSFHFKKHPQGIHKTLDFPKPNLPQFNGYRDLNEQLDSIELHEFSAIQGAWVTTGAPHFTYTNDHLLATESYFDFDLDNGDLLDGQQDEYFYNDLGLCTLHYFNELDIDSGDWMRSDREQLVYNDDLLNTEFITSIWFESLNKFLYNTKFTTSYTTSHKVEDKILFYWSGGAWNSFRKTTNIYNTLDSILFINEYIWDDSLGMWNIDDRKEYFYTNDTLLDSIIESNDSGSGLEPYKRTIFLNNAEGLVASETGFRWNDSIWIPDDRYEYEYTPDKNPNVLSYYEWDVDEKTFVGNYREEYSYTAAGDPLVQAYSDYDTDTQSWVPDYRTEIFYDDNVDASTIVWPNSPLDEPNFFHLKPLYAVDWFYDSNEWFVEDTALLFYGNLISATIPMSKLNVTVYPNPASDQITIQMENLDPDATIIFFDQLGKPVARNRVQTNVPVNISNLLPGAYVFQIRNGAELYSGKILKE